MACGAVGSPEFMYENKFSIILTTCYN